MILRYLRVKIDNLIGGVIDFEEKYPHLENHEVVFKGCVICELYGYVQMFTLRTYLVNKGLLC